MSGAFSYTSTGTGVSAYIVDTGIRFGHSEFGGRAVTGYDAVDGGAAEDCDGHGTHVAGTAGGSTYGVAKQATLIGVRVLDCSGSGTYSGVIAGVDWVTADNDPGEPAVANMSLGGGASSALQEHQQPPALHRPLDRGRSTVWNTSVGPRLGCAHGAASSR